MRADRISLGGKLPLASSRLRRRRRFGLEPANRRCFERVMQPTFTIKPAPKRILTLLIARLKHKHRAKIAAFGRQIPRKLNASRICTADVELKSHGVGNDEDRLTVTLCKNARARLLESSARRLTASSGNSSGEASKVSERARARASCDVKAASLISNNQAAQAIAQIWRSSESSHRKKKRAFAAADQSANVCNASLRAYNRSFRPRGRCHRSSGRGHRYRRRSSASRKCSRRRRRRRPRHAAMVFSRRRAFCFRNRSTVFAAKRPPARALRTIHR